MTLSIKEQVSAAISRGQSGAIEVMEMTSEGGTRQPDMKVVAALLEASCSVKTRSNADVSVDLDRKVIHPLTEKGWEAIEWLSSQPGWEVGVNGQRAAFASTLFQGVGVEASHDHENIRATQRQSEQERALEGYGTGLWGLRG